MKPSNIFLSISLIVVSICFPNMGRLNAQTHLLLSEIVLGPAEAEFIEIYNPLEQAVELNRYFLADNNQYPFLPGKYCYGPEPSLGLADFIAQFPPSSVIEANSTLVIAFDGDEFDNYYGFRADYEINSTDPNTLDMNVIEGGPSINITNNGEGIILFYWDGTSDLVKDVDLLNAGQPDLGFIVDKTGISVDGPDVGTQATFYLDDAHTIPIQSAVPGMGFSTKRIRFEESNETHANGNGITGDDETTENILVTWDSDYSLPTPNVLNLNLSVNELSDYSPILKVYPNPALKDLSIEIANVDLGTTVMIYLEKLNGEIIEKREIEVTVQPYQTRLNIDSYPKGLYLLRVVSDKEARIAPFVVQ